MTKSLQHLLAPPFTLETAIQKVRKAEDNWNSRNPHNDLLIQESERLFHWPIGWRPDDHPGLSELDL